MSSSLCFLFIFGENMSLCTRRAMLQTCDFFVTFSSRSLCSSVYPLFTFSLLSLYLCLVTLSSALDFILFTCLLSFHMLLTFYHMHTIFHMLTIITCLPFITCYFIYLDYKIPAVIRRPQSNINSQSVSLSSKLVWRLVLPFSLRLVPDFPWGTYGAC